MISTSSPFTIRGIETVTSGALDPNQGTTLLSVTGTQAYTLADGTMLGQRKRVRCTVAASTPAGTLTPKTASGFTTAAFNAVEDTLELEWTAAGWVCLLNISVTLA